MAFSLDSYFGIHEQALRIRSRRTEVLASNLANADTPHFKARDLDFSQALGAANKQTVTLKTTHPRHINPQETLVAGAELKYRNPYQPSLDGNTVETDMEQAAFAENAVQYQATLTFLSGKIRSLLTAITGGQ